MANMLQKTRKIIGFKKKNMVYEIPTRGTGVGGEEGGEGNHTWPAAYTVSSFS